MKRRTFSWALMLSVACSALLFTGCSTVETRISEHPEMYGRLGETDRALVSQGRIRAGMARDAVYLAWGAPDQVSQANVRGRPAETWIYTSTTSAGYGPGYGGYGPSGFGYGGYGYGRFGGSGSGYTFAHMQQHHSGHHVFVGYGPFYDPFYDPFFYRRSNVVNYPERTVSFQNGRVVAFQFLNPPRVY